MSFDAIVSATGFQVTANNALDYIVGSQVAGAGYVGENVKQLARTFHKDIGGLSRTIVESSAQIRDVNSAGFATLSKISQSGFSSLKVLAGANLAVQAIGFAIIAKQLHGIGGDIRALRADLVSQGQELLAVQRAANASLESLVDFAGRTLHTQDRILETLVSSRTVEAQQLIRQGWDNLCRGYADEAFSRFLKSLDYDNTIFVTHSQLGQIYADRHEDAAAENHFKRAVAFAGSASTDMQGFAELQYARFLDERGRLKDAVAQVDQALEKADRNEWRFYRCELLTRLDRSDEALRALEELITRDAAYFAVASSSVAISGIGKPLIERLVAIDEASRAPILTVLEEAHQLLPVIEALAEVVPSLLPFTRMADFRSRGGALLEAALRTPFSGLAKAKADAEAYVESARQEIESVMSAIVAPLEALMTRLADHDKQRPPATATDEIRTVPTWLWVLSFALWFVFPVGTVIACLADILFWIINYSAKQRKAQRSRGWQLTQRWADRRRVLLEEFHRETETTTRLFAALAFKVGHPSVDRAKARFLELVSEPSVVVSDGETHEAGDRMTDGDGSPKSCPKCRWVNAPLSTTCIVCATSLPLRSRSPMPDEPSLALKVPCPLCREPIKPAARFCKHCRRNVSLT